MKTLHCDKKIAVLLATYNGEKYLREQLDSLLAQDFDDFACFIHDDDSTDNTREIIAEYCNTYPETFIEIKEQRTGEKGARDNFLFLLKKVEADYYMYCDQDDVWLPKKISKTFSVIMKHTIGKPACVYTDLKVVDQKLNIISNSYFSYRSLDPWRNSYKTLLIISICTGCTMMLNRMLRDEVLKLKCNSYIHMHDIDTAITAALLGDIEFLDEPTILYRQHNDNNVGANPQKGILSSIIHIFRDFGAARERCLYFYRKAPRHLASDFEALCTPGEKQTFLHELANIGQRYKLARMRFYVKNQLLPQRITRKLWGLLWV